ncbi:hypothetical protein J6590_083022 [Homalodisca vitripennis]|nr:hypothetical protein J6590_083022 [Homalodisca vitripennis]
MAENKNNTRERSHWVCTRCRRSELARSCIPVSEATVDYQWASQTKDQDKIVSCSWINNQDRYLQTFHF